MERKASMRFEKIKLDAPGLKTRSNKDGTQRLYWCARSDLVKKGYQPETVRLSFDIVDAGSQKLIEAACQRLQAEMLEWSTGTERDVLRFDGTLRGLVRRYQLDPASPYQGVKWNTRRTYDEILVKIDRGLGERSVHAIKLDDFHRWYAEAKKPKLPGQPERITKAHNLMRMLRRLFSYGIMAELQGCKRVHEILEQAQFKGAARRRTVLNFGYVQAFITEAIKSNRRSLALGTALQFETGMRQKDVIGEWEPMVDGEVSGIILNDRRWVNGLTWSDLGSEFVISKVTTKTGAVVSHDLKLCPLTQDLLRQVPVDQRVGPFIIDENSGLPYAAHGYAREWRAIARKAGIPDSVWNMDARAGAITEAEDAGVDLDIIRGAVGHTQASTTARYSRGAIGKSRTVATQRLAHRTKLERE
jgi:integrase